MECDIIYLLDVTFIPSTVLFTMECDMIYLLDVTFIPNLGLLAELLNILVIREGGRMSDIIYDFKHNSH